MPQIIVAARDRFWAPCARPTAAPSAHLADSPPVSAGGTGQGRPPAERRGTASCLRCSCPSESRARPGSALFEECLCDDEGLITRGSIAEYLVPMAGEMPDIVVAHVETPTRSSLLGAKGAGEAGTAGAPGAVVNAINDALRPLKAEDWSQPVTPEKVLRALGHI